jgi:hypothetical protein
LLLRQNSVREPRFQHGGELPEVMSLFTCVVHEFTKRIRIVLQVQAIVTVVARSECVAGFTIAAAL